MNSKESGLLIDFTGQETQYQNPPHLSFDAWPKDQSSPSIIAWSDELKSYRTLLSMSTPIETSEFSSSSSLDLSSLRLSPEFNPIQMGLGVNTDVTDQTKNQANWISISWGSSIGGPLGEVLSNTTNNVDNSKSSSTLTLLPKEWDESTQLGSSPALLHQAPFGSLSKT
ncbi:hypothetical protein V6N13_034653 [Hibiscus sabdariffa]|uniref:Uncharacterized protein n=2 Tax=Hibiscus sabdariffa TaxID=183260 RepID=A0ABR2NCK4_9ROSI